MKKLYLLNLLFISWALMTCSNETSTAVNVAAIDRDRILMAANRFLQEKPITITAFSCERSVGGLHDFYSEGDYWWPNPDDPDGPYIRRDGMTNPENFVKHRQVMRQLSVQVPALVAAYKITNEQIYADKAIEHLSAWFIADETRMNPNLLYAQAIKGRVTGRGIGIIDTIHLVEVAQAVMVLEQLKAIDKNNLEAIKKWFCEYLDWMFNHEYGIKERDNGNNHSTCWAMQVAIFARLVEDEEKLAFCRKFYKTVLLPDQIASDGCFPKEIRRTKPYNYSLFNLDAMAMVCQIISVDQDNLWNFQLDDGRGIKKAVEFMAPYVKDKSSWPYPPDVMYFDLWPVRHPFLLFAGLAYNNMDYIDLWKTLNPDPINEEVLRNYPIRQPVLWLNK